MSPVQELPLSSVTLTAAEEAGHYADHHRQHQVPATDLRPGPASVRYAWPSVASRPFRHMAH